MTFPAPPQWLARSYHRSNLIPLRERRHLVLPERHSPLCQSWMVWKCWEGHDSRAPPGGGDSLAQSRSHHTSCCWSQYPTPPPLWRPVTTGQLCSFLGWKLIVTKLVNNRNIITWVLQWLREYRSRWREVWDSVESLQDLHCGSETIIVREPHILIELLPGSVLVILAHTRPVETAVTATTAVTVL